MAKVSMGQSSKIFTSRGQQLLKEVSAKNECAFEKWCPKERDEFEYQDEVSITLSELFLFIREHVSS